MRKTVRQHRGSWMVTLFAVCAGFVPVQTSAECYETYCWDCGTGSQIEGIYRGEMLAGLNYPYEMRNERAQFSMDLAALYPGSSFTSPSDTIVLNNVASGDRWIEIDNFYYQFDEIICEDKLIDCDSLGFVGTPSTVYSGEEVIFSISGSVVAAITGLGISFGDAPIITYPLTPWNIIVPAWMTGHIYTSGGIFTGTFTYDNGEEILECDSLVQVSRCGDGLLNGDESCDDGIQNGDPGMCNLTCDGMTPTCGDNIVEPGEACDFGDVLDGDGCSSLCQWEDPSCEDVLLFYDPSALTGDTPLTITVSGNVGGNSWIGFSEIDFDEGMPVLIGSGQFEEEYIYTDTGIYTLAVLLENIVEGSGNYVEVCETEVIVGNISNPDCEEAVSIEVDFMTGYDTLTITNITCEGTGVITEEVMIYDASGSMLFGSGDSFPLIVSGSVGDLLIECLVNTGGPSLVCSDTLAGASYCGDAIWESTEEECDGTAHCDGLCVCDVGYHPNGMGVCVGDASGGSNGGPSSSLGDCIDDPDCEVIFSIPSKDNFPPISSEPPVLPGSTIEDLLKTMQPGTEVEILPPRRINISEIICVRNGGPACGTPVITTPTIPSPSQPTVPTAPIQPIIGCTQSIACNRNPRATIDDGSCVAPQGCNERCPGEGGSPRYVDECGVCGGNGSTCKDCAGIVGGEHQLDGCGVCKHPSDPTFGQDCMDCAGEMQGRHLIDQCGQCVLPSDPLYNSCLDCLGVPNGKALIGSDCNDSDPSTILDHWSQACECEGLPVQQAELSSVEPTPIELSFTPQLWDAFTMCSLKLSDSSCVEIVKRHTIRPSECISKKISGLWSGEVFTINTVENFPCDDDFSYDNEKKRLPGTVYVDISAWIEARELEDILETKFTEVRMEQPFLGLGISTWKISVDLGSQQTTDLIDFLSQYEGVQTYHPEPRFTISQTNKLVQDSGNSQNYLEMIGRYEAIQECPTVNQKVVVAVIDNAFETTHEDLKNNIIASYDITDGDTDVLPPQNNGERSHGSVAAGIISADSSNETGIEGISHDAVQLITIKATDDDAKGGDITAGIEGIAKAIELRADIISISRGTYANQPILMLEKVIQKANERDIRIVASAGNFNKSEPFYPAAYEQVIAVAAVDDQGRKAPFSNYGAWVDLAAPGVGINSTDLGNSYGQFDGTSSAAPVVAGVLGRGRAHGLSDEQILGNLQPLVSDLELGEGIIRMPTTCTPATLSEPTQEHGAAEISPQRKYLQTRGSIILALLLIVGVLSLFGVVDRKKK